MIFSGKLVPGKIGRFDEETHFPDNWTAVQFEFLYFVWNTDDDSGNSHPPHSSLSLSLSSKLAPTLLVSLTRSHPPQGTNIVKIISYLYSVFPDKFEL